MDRGAGRLQSMRTERVGHTQKEYTHTDTHTHHVPYLGPDGYPFSTEQGVHYLPILPNDPFPPSHLQQLEVCSLSKSLSENAQHPYCWYEERFMDLDRRSNRAQHFLKPKPNRDHSPNSSFLWRLREVKKLQKKNLKIAGVVHEV